MVPPPDPLESPHTQPGARMAAPAAVFVNGRPSREVDRLADAILAVRPGALVVVVR